MAIAGLVSGCAQNSEGPSLAGGRPVEKLDGGTAEPLVDSGGTGETGVVATDDAGNDFDPNRVKSCATLGLPGLCIDVHNEAELAATHDACPFRDVCRIVVHPGTYNMAASIFTYHHWYRHYIGVADANGNRPVLTSKVGSVFAHKGSQDRQQNTVLQNMIFNGPVQGVDFDGATGAPYNTKGGLSWLDRITIDMDSREVFFNSGPNPGGGSFWCTRCELIHRVTPLNPNSMIAIGQIDSAWFSQSTLRSEVWNNAIVGIAARSIGFDNVVDEKANPVGCGSYGIVCHPGEKPELLRAPTLAWFESLVFAQPH